MYAALLHFSFAYLMGGPPFGGGPGPLKPPPPLESGPDCYDRIQFLGVMKLKLKFAMMKLIHK